MLAAPCILLAGTLACVPGAAQSAAVAADTAVSSATPSTNYGTLSNLYVNAASTALLSFDMSVLPAGTAPSSIARATLRVYVNRVNAAGVVTVSPVRSAWAESAVTFQTIPQLGSAASVFPVTDEGQFVTVDITAVVQGWLTSPTQNFGLALSSTAADLVLDSKENDTTAHPAEVVIAFAGGSGASGATGSTGPAGPMGPQGPAGPAGVAGPVGPGGPQGPAGLTGPAGPQGPAGAPGPPGPQGAVGAAGVVFRGVYASTTNYGRNDVVTWANATWISLSATNSGNTPDSSPTQWAVFVPAAIGQTGPQGPEGPIGLTGPPGPMGSPGVDGATGPQGPAGAVGRPGFVYRGTYASTTNYAAGDVVLWQGGSWASLVDGNTGQTPDRSPANWGALTSVGPAGPAGPAGATGATGLQGPAGQVGAAGPQGISGPAGQAGAQGPQGVAGTPGATGTTGPQGPQGIAGPVGIQFRGAYASSTNYGLNDAVTWANATWISLQATNFGNTPDSSPNFWAMLAAPGATGPTGATGAPGPQGPVGLTGPTGAAGPQGVAGAAGPAGPAGMQFQGAYRSGTNYSLHDAVTWGGGTWISLAATNLGNTPDSSPAWWAQVAAPGVAGPVGPAGPTGATGLTGPQGPTGAAGPQGAAGANGAPGAPGAMGPTGPAGAAGATGPQGPAGANGSPGLLWQGLYNPATSYAVGDAVAYNGSSYLSTQSGNHGNPPDATGSPAWTLLAQQGAVGPTGATGATGSIGATGASGAAATVSVGSVVTTTAGSAVQVSNSGTSSAAVLNFSIPQGAQGLPGLSYKGRWTTGTGYATGDVVYRSGSSYVSNTAGNTADPAVSVANNTGEWSTLASEGAPGAATVSIGAVTTGSSAAVTNSGTQNAAVLNFTLPQGPMGATGATGPAGLAFRGAWAGGNTYSRNDLATYNGSAYVALAANTGVAPLGAAASTSDWALLAAAGQNGTPGAMGPSGPTGPAATIAIGTVTTGAAGTAAAVTNSGSSTAAVLNFTLPQGAAGAGAGGGGGVYSSMHTVQASSVGVYGYSPLQDMKGNVGSYATLGYLPSTCNLGSVQVYNSSSSTVQFEIYTGTPGSMTMPASLSACNVGPSSPGNPTSCPGPGTLGSSNFVTFVMTNSSSYSTYVYTQFSCQ